MKIFLTGATGFVGAHTARALLDAGHELRLLVRNRQAAETYFAEYGYEVDDIVVCDMLDREAVKQGMRGCDAVIHAAAVVDLNARNAVQTQRINLQGIDSVIGSACDLGIPRIIYVSSMSALLTPGAGVIDEEAALGEANDAYSKSKQMCEQKVRSLQARGYPIVITYPSGVFGPDDPRMSQSNDAFMKFFQLMVPMTSAGIQHVDVRDVARAHLLLLQKPLENDKTRERYLVAGFFTPWREFALQLERASGIPIRKVPVLGWLFRLIGVLFDAARVVVNISLPVTIESTRIVTQSPQFDSSRLLKTVDMQFRDPLETYADTVAWLRRKGHLKK